MYRRFAHYTEPAKVARSVEVVAPEGVKWLSPGLENLDALLSPLKPTKTGTLEHDPASTDVRNVTNDSDYLLDKDIE
jgi:hypothetical protein